MKKQIVYYVVTEKPMYIGQHIRFDGKHHNGVWQRVNEKTECFMAMQKIALAAD